MEASRTEFLHIVPWQQGLFYALVFASLLALVAQIVWRVRRLSPAKPRDWSVHPVRNLIRYAIGQARVQEARRRSLPPRFRAVLPHGSGGGGGGMHAGDDAA